MKSPYLLIALDHQAENGEGKWDLSLVSDGNAEWLCGEPNGVIVSVVNEHGKGVETGEP